MLWDGERISYGRGSKTFRGQQYYQTLELLQTTMARRENLLQLTPPSASMTPAPLSVPALLELVLLRA